MFPPDNIPIIREVYKALHTLKMGYFEEKNKKNKKKITPAMLVCDTLM